MKKTYSEKGTLSSTMNRVINASALADEYKDTANVFFEEDRLDEAEHYFQGALEICRRLAVDSPDEYAPLAAALYNTLGIVHAKNDHLKEAEDSFVEALDIYLRLAEMNPDNYDEFAASIYMNLGTLYNFQDPNQVTDSETLYQEAADIFTRLAEKDPWKYRPDAAEVYDIFAEFYLQRGLYENAELLYRKALDIRYMLAKFNRDFVPELAGTYNGLAMLYSDTGRKTEAEHLYRKALSICRSEAIADPETYEILIGTLCFNIAGICEFTGRKQEAERYYWEAKRLASLDPETFTLSWEDAMIFYKLTK